MTQMLFTWVFLTLVLAFLQSPMLLAQGNGQGGGGGGNTGPGFKVYELDRQNLADGSEQDLNENTAVDRDGLPRIN